MLTPDPVDAAGELCQLGPTETPDGGLGIDAEPCNGLIDRAGADAVCLGKVRQGGGEWLMWGDVLARRQGIQKVVVLRTDEHPPQQQ